MYKLSASFIEFSNDETFISSCKDYIKRIGKALTKPETELDDIESILLEYGIRNISDAKLDTLQYLISYANFILEDDSISENELYDFTVLKRIFRINEGDFIKYHFFEVREILKKQFLRIYEDDFVDKGERLESVNLQSFFDLSYDEFEGFKKEYVIASLINGADPKDLDISKLPKGFQFK
ncbi:hypothetical protein [Pedobacter montanisoli]|uniref:Uncharacterized protein n=1 Tax=Pedobacter montanisoli TaxID=2923277 RepID=A0ABS9ZWN1_9SPHI|nr:hypothetical protein [Pedobacter montanisoli]MCJ0742699.1 hypothetical protein [Pedobacter montanisoli]